MSKAYWAGTHVKRAAVSVGAAAAAATLTIGVAVPSASAAATYGTGTGQLTDASGTIDPVKVAAALAEVLRDYAKGTPPAQFPAELTALLPALQQLGPSLLSELGSPENVAQLQSLDFGFLLNDLGLNLPSLDQLLPIPSTFSFGGQDFPLPINVITTGPAFGALGLLGLNPFWVPAFPDAIAREINQTPYASINTDVSVPVTVDNPLYQQMYDVAYNGAYAIAYAPAYASKLNQLAQQATTGVWQSTYDRTYASLTSWCGRFCSTSVKNAAAASARTAADAAVAAAYASALANPTYQAQADAAGQAAGTAAGLDAVANIPHTVDLTATVPLTLDNYRIPIVIASGPGALAAGMAYPQVVADLPNQPGGTAPGAEPGSSLTILPMILLRNPGRANGGLAARFAPYFALIGLNTVTPDFAVAQDGNAVLVPEKVDATVEYDPLSDFPAWPNPFSLANSGAALLFPTYILRGTSIDPNNIGGTLTPILDPVLNTALGNILSALIGDGKTVDVSGSVLGQDFTLPITLTREQILAIAQGQLPDGITIPAEGYQALNQYLTIRSGALPLLEPLRLPFDVLNMMTGGNFSNPIADAIEPALRILVNLGYTDVDPANGYQRTLDQAGLGANTGGVPFGTMPTNVNWTQATTDVLTALLTGFQTEFLSGGIPGVHDPSDPQPNPLATVFGLLGLPTSPQQITTLADTGGALLPAANELPTLRPAQTLTVPTTQELQQQSVVSDNQQALAPQPATQPAPEQVTATPQISLDAPAPTAHRAVSKPKVSVGEQVSASRNLPKKVASDIRSTVKSVTGSIDSAVKTATGGGDHAG